MQDSHETTNSPLTSNRRCSKRFCWTMCVCVCVCFSFHAAWPEIEQQERISYGGVTMVQCSRGTSECWFTPGDDLFRLLTAIYSYEAGQLIEIYCIPDIKLSLCMEQQVSSELGRYRTQVSRCRPARCPTGNQPHLQKLCSQYSFIKRVEPQAVS